MVADAVRAVRDNGGDTNTAHHDFTYTYDPNGNLTSKTPAGFADAVDQLAHVAQSIDELATNLNADAGRLLTSLADVVEENRTALNGLTTHVASITEKLDRGAGTLGRLVNDPKLYERVTDTVADVQQSVREIGAVARNLNEGQGTLGKLLANGLSDKVVLVGHSQGGMMPRYYLKFLDGAGKVDDPRDPAAPPVGRRFEAGVRSRPALRRAVCGVGRGHCAGV